MISGIKMHESKLSTRDDYRYSRDPVREGRPESINWRSSAHPRSTSSKYADLSGQLQTAQSLRQNGGDAPTGVTKGEVVVSILQPALYVW